MKRAFPDGFSGDTIMAPEICRERSSHFRRHMDLPLNLTETLKGRFVDRQTASIANALITLATDSNVKSELPELDQLANVFLSALERDNESALETALLSLYTCVHKAGSRYSPSEQACLKSKEGYVSYPGGFSPLIRAEPFIGPDTVVADLGAGNGLQGLLFQYLYPHRMTIQIELSAEMIRVGRILQEALMIHKDRIVWINDDLVNVSIENVDFVYIYRPARPLKAGREVYREIARKLIRGNKSRVVFSIADCLAGFMKGHFSVFHSDGHLTCFKKETAGDPAGRESRI
jgi:hypothetical protein